VRKHKTASLKCKEMAFKARVPIRSKIVILKDINTILKQINTFTYLGCEIRGCIQNFRTESIKKYTLTFGTAR
jgi:hypothetical protein